MRCPRRALLLALPGVLLGRAAAGQPAGDRMATRCNTLAERLLAAEAGPRAGAMVSGLSLLDALAPLGPGARSEAATALARLLGPRGAQALALHQALSTDEALKRAAAVWLPRRPPPLPAYREAVAPLGAHVEAVEFAVAETLGRINGWVAERTNNLIPTLLDRLPRDPGVVVTAALHFAARWEIPFDPAQTLAGPFTRGDGQRMEARFMRAMRLVPYAESRSWRAVRLPYTQGQYEAVLLAPAPGRPATQAAQALRDRTALAVLAALRFDQAEVELSVPRLALNQTIDLLPRLRQGNLGAAFAPEADFRGIDGTPIRLTAIRQRVALRLDESGTQAAAATAVLGDRAMVERARFVADRPFLLLVVHRPTGLHIVTALVNEPGTT
ncbi:Serpin (serine protease inhibitor) [Falsiroseomonas stagni DSM 19981]|uniref:Serpin (Serine protease inhibitor) n=2 Tax=Falsiroseomonas TaxID=2870713 RepID=A0A1I4FI23_9PROT|nr:Serpin (serine protease inhibitor) [Falsiroseomonas stagni DSM 19981]